MTSESKAEIARFISSWMPRLKLKEAERMKFIEDVSLLALACVESGAKDGPDLDKIYREFKKSHS